ncbi:MAG: tRNA 2-thiouridine(34) synthase MnmA [Patescibacteria group bacterium]|nr:tRNA 2-thiouridine(34) synthase MnmA [Patescibacteria group bacterium]MDD4611087.1 tRNA 2-thiouridine(34) synthase MnmA [Patescibacteria group bacterium]
MIKKKRKIIVAISGGVDSSVTAMILKKAGYEVMGVFMRLGVENKNAEDAARHVCQKLGIKFYPVNLAPEFKKEIINYFLESYERGITPNPCVKCNKFIKFGKLLQIARELGADYLATGHYVKSKKYKVKSKKYLYKLIKGKDESKDQSYFLYTLTQEKLQKILFPLGDYKKEDIKKIAAKAGLPNLKTESQDVCFLPGEHNEFLKGKIKLKPGKIIALTSAKPLPGSATPLLIRRGDGGEVVGEHKGLPLYTIGQRRGVEIGGTGPYYVVKCDYKKNILYVTSDHDDPLLYSDKFYLSNVNWVSCAEPKFPFKCEVVIRYRHKPIKCTLAPCPSPCLAGRQASQARGAKKEQGNVAWEQDNALFARLEKPERAITAGQSAVFYKGDEILGGGIIEI